MSQNTRIYIALAIMAAMISLMVLEAIFYGVTI